MNCHYCQRLSKKELLDPIRRPNGEIRYRICHWCRISKEKGKVFKSKTKTWLGERKELVYVKKDKPFYFIDKKIPLPFSSEMGRSQGANKLKRFAKVGYRQWAD